MTAISAADGPVVVTGASGYIGSWIVRDFMEQGYEVRACVRDATNPEKVDHLLAMNETDLRGHLELYEADLLEPGSYDAAADGSCAVIHAGAAVGYNKETPQEVYDGCFTEVRHVIDSAIKAGSVKRFVLTSSFAAVDRGSRPETPLAPTACWPNKSWVSRPTRSTRHCVPPSIRISRSASSRPLRHRN